MVNKRILHLSIIITLYFTMSVVFCSCCKDNYYRIKSVDLIEAIQYTQGYSSVDSITQEFFIRVYNNLEYLAYSQLSIINEAYALSCEKTIVNPIDISSVNIQLDKTFIFEDSTIVEGSPIQNLDGFIIDSYDGSLDLHFSQLFMDNAIFEEELYQYSISWMTFDTIPESFSGDISLFMNNK